MDLPKSVTDILLKTEILLSQGYLTETQKMDLARRAEALHRPRIGLVGKTGAGKSTTLNRLIGEDLLPTLFGNPTTCVATEVTYQEGTNYHATIELLPMENWTSFVEGCQEEMDTSFLETPNDSPGEDVDVGGVDHGEDDYLKEIEEPRFVSGGDLEKLKLYLIAFKLLSPYESDSAAAKYIRGKSPLDLLPDDVREALSDRHPNQALVDSDLASLKAHLERYLYRSNPREKPNDVLWWPVVQKVSIFGPFEKLRSLVLIDMPHIGGGEGENEVRDATLADRFDEALASCDFVYLVSQLGTYGRSNVLLDYRLRHRAPRNKLGQVLTRSGELKGDIGDKETYNRDDIFEFFQHFCRQSNNNILLKLQDFLGDRTFFIENNDDPAKWSSLFEAFEEDVHKRSKERIDRAVNLLIQHFNALRPADETLKKVGKAVQAYVKECTFQLSSLHGYQPIKPVLYNSTDYRTIAAELGNGTTARILAEHYVDLTITILDSQIPSRIQDMQERLVADLAEKFAFAKEKIIPCIVPPPTPIEAAPRLLACLTHFFSPLCQRAIITGPHREKRMRNAIATFITLNHGNVIQLVQREYEIWRTEAQTSLNAHYSSLLQYAFTTNIDPFAVELEVEPELREADTKVDEGTFQSLQSLVRSLNLVEPTKLQPLELNPNHLTRFTRLLHNRTLNLSRITTTNETIANFVEIVRWPLSQVSSRLATIFSVRSQDSSTRKFYQGPAGDIHAIGNLVYQLLAGPLLHYQVFRIMADSGMLPETDFYWPLDLSTLQLPRTASPINWGHGQEAVEELVDSLDSLFRSFEGACFRTLTRRRKEGRVSFDDLECFFHLICHSWMSAALGPQLFKGSELHPTVPGFTRRRIDTLALSDDEQDIYLIEIKAPDGDSLDQALWQCFTTVYFDIGLTGDFRRVGGTVENLGQRTPDHIFLVALSLDLGHTVQAKIVSLAAAIEALPPAYKSLDIFRRKGAKQRISDAPQAIRDAFGAFPPYPLE